MTRYDFSQESANEMLEQADLAGVALTKENGELRTRLATLEAIAEEMAVDMRGCESCYEQKSLATYEAYRATIVEKE